MNAPPPLPPELYRHGSAYRHHGAADVARLLGVGFLRKEGVRVDRVHNEDNHYSLVLVLRGRGAYRDEPTGRTWTLGPGDVFQRFPARGHSLLIEPESRWAECWVAFGTVAFGVLEGYGVADPADPVWRVELRPALVRRFERLQNELHAAPEADLPALLLRMAGLVVDLRRAAARDPGADADGRVLAAACQRLREDPDARLHLPAVAGELGIGYEKLRKLFRRRLGIGPGAYRIRCRIEAACSLLASGELSVKEVAHRLGYPNPYAFSSQFRDAMGVPPSTFRQREAGRGRV
ncbi:MAG: AraC family transcriptional regulator [Planctomycetota bacterium]